MSKILSSAMITGLLLAVAAGAEAQVKKDPIQAPQGVSGAATFKSYCAQCHGIAGKGNGPAAKALVVAPADLTQMAKRHGGKFPAADAKATIAGDHALAAHGTREMPMWGPVFRSVENNTITELRLVNLVKYLEQIQEK